MEWADKYVALRGGYNLDIYHDISADILAANQRAHGVTSTARWQNTRWALTRVPNSAFAQQAGLDLETVTDMYFNACLLDYEKEEKKWFEITNLIVPSWTDDFDMIKEMTDWLYKQGFEDYPIHFSRFTPMAAAPVWMTLSAHSSRPSPGTWH